MKVTSIPGFCIRGRSFGDALTLLGAQARWIQPSVNTANAKLFAARIASLADALVAAYLFKEPTPAALQPLMSSTLWTLASARIDQAQRAHRAGVALNPGVNCDVRLQLWLLPKQGLVLGRAAPGRVSLFKELLDVSGIEDFSVPSGGEVLPGFSAQQVQERIALWALTTSAATSCCLEMGWEPAWPTTEDVAAQFEKVAARAQRCARERALARFCDVTRNPAVVGIPEPLRAVKALQLLSQADSSLSQSCVEERTRLSAGLLPPSSLAARMAKPLSTVLSRI